MKKLLTLALGILMSSALLNAQTCEFTYTSDSLTGTYTYSAPADFNPMLYTFVWYYNNGSGFGSSNTLTVTYNSAMNDVVSLSIFQNDSNLVCTSTQTIAVWGGGSTGSQCPIAYNQSPADPYTFVFFVPGSNYAPTWTFSDGTTAAGMEVSNTFPGPGMYSVCMNVTGGGATCSNCIDVFIPADSTVTPSCSADFWTSTSALTGYFIPTNSNYNSAVTYTWTFGDGTSSVESFPYHVYETAGVYEVCLTASSELCNQQTCQQVEILAADPVYPDSLCGSFFIINQTDAYNIDIINGTSGVDLNFDWSIYNADGSIAAADSGAYPTMLMDNFGLFNICLTVTNANGCTAMYCDSFYVDTTGLLGGRLNSTGFTINVVSPQVMTGFITGIENTTSDAAFGLYPNPFSDVVTINTGAKSFKSYAIYSVDGKQVQAGAINGTVQTLNTADLSHGIYVLTLTDAKGERQVQKLVKK